MKRLYIFWFCGALSFFMGLPAPVFAQNFQEDIPFFVEKSTEYQHWLDKAGLGGALEVQQVKLAKEGRELELHLRLRPTHLDSAIGLWHRLQLDYKAANGIALEEKLFQVFVRKMEIPPANGNIQVYVFNKRGEYIPCFYVPIWEENGVVMSEEVIGECKDKPVQITFKPQPLRQTTKGKTTYVERQLSANDVFDKVMSFIRHRYGKTDCFDRYPTIVEELRTESMLKVSVSDLCRVVLTDETQSMWCGGVQLLGWKCNDVRRERLEFEFYYLSNARSISGKLTGKFGSGVYRPRKSGYMDMEPDFDDYLEEFNRKFHQELKSWLER
jgi:hypothetical protein